MAHAGKAEMRLAFLGIQDKGLLQQQKLWWRSRTTPTSIIASKEFSTPTMTTTGKELSSRIAIHHLESNEMITLI